MSTILFNFFQLILIPFQTLISFQKLSIFYLIVSAYLSNIWDVLDRVATFYEYREDDENEAEEGEDEDEDEGQIRTNFDEPEDFYDDPSPPPPPPSAPSSSSSCPLDVADWEQIRMLPCV